MPTIGDTVKVHYTGKYTDGKVFDSTVASEPILFTIGDEMMLPAFEEAVISMVEGEAKIIKLKSKDAYGEYDEDLLIEVNKKDVFGDKKLEKGATVQAPTDEGVMVFKVHDVKDEVVVLDANSEMAGKDVIFEIELLSITKGESDYSTSSNDFEDELDNDDFSDDFIDDSYDINDF